MIPTHAHDMAWDHHSLVPSRCASDVSMPSMVRDDLGVSVASVAVSVVFAAFDVAVDVDVRACKHGKIGGRTI